jgi:hypothetical protein
MMPREMTFRRKAAEEGKVRLPLRYPASPPWTIAGVISPTPL